MPIKLGVFPLTGVPAVLVPCDRQPTPAAWWRRIEARPELVSTGCDGRSTWKPKACGAQQK